MCWSSLEINFAGQWVPRSRVEYLCCSECIVGDSNSNAVLIYCTAVQTWSEAYQKTHPPLKCLKSVSHYSHSVESTYSLMYMWKNKEEQTAYFFWMEYFTLHLSNPDSSSTVFLSSVCHLHFSWYILDQLLTNDKRNEVKNPTKSWFKSLRKGHQFPLSTFWHFDKDFVGFSPLLT